MHDRAPDASWLPSPAAPAVAPDEVHVWRASLAPRAAVMARLHDALATDELAKAAHFRFPRHRTRFVAGRGIQRAILGRYLRAEPGALGFRVTAHGKPELIGATDGVRFNATNCGDRALYAVALRREVGVDLEAIRSLDDADQIAAQFFSAAEREALRALPDAARATAFFSVWARKEAFIKALGEGLSVPLQQFDVSVAPGEPARIVRSRVPGETRRWTMYEPDAGPGWAAALVAEGGACTLRLFDWDSEASR